MEGARIGAEVGKEADLVGQEVQQEHPQKERRHGHADQAEDRKGAVANAVLPEGADHADGDADEQLEDDAEDGDHHRRREALQDRLHHRELVDVGVAQVGMCEVPHVEPVLVVQWLVEPELMADLHQHLGSRVWPGDLLGRVGRDGEGQQERDEAHAEDHHHRPQQSPDDVLAHDSSPSLVSRPSSPSLLRVKSVAQAVAHEVEGKHGDHDAEAGEDDQPGRGQHVRLAVRDHLAPRGRRRLDAEADV